MDCPHCRSSRVSFLQRKTNLGYAMFRCKQCRRTYNKRTDTPFNFIAVPTDIVFQALLLRVRYKLIKHRYHPTLGFGEFGAAHRFCKTVDEVSNFLRPRSRMAEFVSLSDRRNKLIKGVSELQELFQAA